MTAARGCALVIAAAAAVARGEPPAPGGEPAGAEVSVEDAVRATLAHSPDIAIAGQALESRQGALDAERGRFDLVLTAAAGQRGELAPPGAGSADAAAIDPWARTYTTSYELGAAQTLRGGLRLEPHAAVSRSAGTGIDPAYAEAHVGVTVTQPLWRGRGAASTAARERAAEQSVDAAGLRLRQAVAQGVLATVQRYWAYRAAWETVRIFTRAEERAAQFVEEERRMIGARERAPTELHQVRAALAEARANRADAERAYVAARQQLGLAMGLGWAAIDALGAPRDPLTVAAGLGAGEAEELIGFAAAHRPDLRAARAELAAAAALVVGAERDTSPRLDLSAELGYAGQARGGGGWPLATALGRELAGPSFFAGLTLELPAQNRAASGAVRQARAASQTQALAARDLERQIGANIALGVAKLRSLAAQLADADEAVEAYEAALANELRKLRSNLSTEFDVLQIESRLTAAQLAELRVRVSVLAELAQLRYETGVLVDELEAGRALSRESFLAMPAVHAAVAR